MERNVQTNNFQECVRRNDYVKWKGMKLYAIPSQEGLSWNRKITASLMKGLHNGRKRLTNGK